MKVLLFGSIAEKVGTDSLNVEGTSLEALRRSLLERIPALDRMSYAIAIDRCVVNGDRPLTGKEEIAVLPPFAGG